MKQGSHHCCIIKEMKEGKHSDKSKIIKAQYDLIMFDTFVWRCGGSTTDTSIKTYVGGIHRGTPSTPLHQELIWLHSASE